MANENNYRFVLRFSASNDSNSSRKPWPPNTKQLFGKGPLYSFRVSNRTLVNSNPRIRVSSNRSALDGQFLLRLNGSSTTFISWKNNFERFARTFLRVTTTNCQSSPK